ALVDAGDLLRLERGRRHLLAGVHVGHARDAAALDRHRDALGRMPPLRARPERHLDAPGLPAHLAADGRRARDGAVAQPLEAAAEARRLDVEADEDEELVAVDARREVPAPAGELVVDDAREPALLDRAEQRGEARQRERGEPRQHPERAAAGPAGIRHRTRGRATSLVAAGRRRLEREEHGVLAAPDEQQDALARLDAADRLVVRVHVGDRLPVHLDDDVAAPEPRLLGHAPRLDARDQDALHVAADAERFRDLRGEVLDREAVRFRLAARTARLALLLHLGDLDADGLLLPVA